MYKVEFLQDQTYQVVIYTYTSNRELTVDIGYLNREVFFQGSLSDCNAWLQLNDKGYL